MRASYFLSFCVRLFMVQAHICKSVLMFVGTCVCWCLCMCVACMWRPEVDIGRLPQFLFTLVFGTGSLIELSQAGYPASSKKIHLSWLPMLWLTDSHSCTWPSVWVLGIQTQALVLAQQAVYLRDHLLSFWSLSSRGRLSCFPSSPQTHLATQVYFELLVILLPPPEC